MKPRALLVSAAFHFVIVPVAALAEVPTVLLLEGDTVDGQTVTAISNTSVNHEGGYAATLTSTGPGGTQSHVWGSHSGGAGAVLRTESAIGIHVQTSFEGFFELGDGGFVGYSPSSTDTTTGTTGLDGVWVNDTIVMIEEAPYLPQPGMFWSFGSRPGMTANGNVHFVGGITNAPGGSSQNRGLFFGPGSQPFDGIIFLIGGQAVGGLPNPITTGGSNISFDYRVSKLGSHFVAEVATATGSTLNDNAMVIDGSVALSSGQPVVEASPVPAASGGLPGENWDNFDFTGVTEDGHWLLTGDTDADAATDEFIALDGVICLREGDPIGMEVVSGAIEGAYLNEDGDVGYIWDYAAGTLEMLGIRVANLPGRGGYDGYDRLLLREGDPVDLDGDGFPESNTAITNFTGISALTMSDRDGSGFVNIYFTADVDIVPASPGGPVVAAAPEETTAGSLEERGLDEDVRGGEERRAVLEAFLVLSVDTQAAVGVAEVQGPASGIRFAVAPNPVAAGDITLRFALPTAAAVTVDLFDVSGRRVRALLNESRGAGEHVLRWDGRDDTGRSVAAGSYFARLETGERVVSRRLLVIR